MSVQQEKKRRLPLIVTAIFLIAFFVLAVLQGRTQYYPWIVFETQDAIRTELVFFPRKLRQNCMQVTASLTQSMLTACPSCRIHESLCLDTLNPTHIDYLSEKALPHPSARLAQGVAVFSAADEGASTAACLETEKNIVRAGQVGRCFKAGESRIATHSKTLPIEPLAFLAGALVAAALVSWLVCWLVIRFEHLHSHLSHDHIDSGPQKFHAVPTPRIGGLGLLSGLFVAGGILNVFQPFGEVTTQEYSYLMLAGMPAFFGGIVEDITKKVGVLERLLLTMLSGAVGAWLIGAVQSRTAIPIADAALVWFPFAVAFSVFAVGGITNSINIIDGYNGLAGGFSVIVCAAMSWVAWQVGDYLVLFTSLALAFSLLGFLSWNWPGGKIFLGDGGAYLLGFVLAELAILLVARNPTVSPWFPLLLLIHPVFETIFSIYRRKFRRGHTPGHPDALHLHQLVYMRLVRIHVGSKEPSKRLERNSQVAPLMWCLSQMFMVPACIWWDKIPATIGMVLLYCAVYTWFYSRIVHWRLPLRLHSTKHHYSFRRG